jgi:hypothetical protein
MKIPEEDICIICKENNKKKGIVGKLKEKYYKKLSKKSFNDMDFRHKLLGIEK